MLNARAIFTGRNEVLAKVIFSQACVILFTGGGGMVWGGLQFFGGASNFSGFFLGGVVSNFSGGPPIFQVGLQFFGGGGLHRNTVNVRPVRILLECILV